MNNVTKQHFRRVILWMWMKVHDHSLVRVFSRSQCINQMKELKEQCEERINEITKKGSDVSQVRENKDFPEDSKKSGQVWWR